VCTWVSWNPLTSFCFWTVHRSRTVRFSYCLCWNKKSPRTITVAIHLQGHNERCWVCVNVIIFVNLKIMYVKKSTFQGRWSIRWQHRQAVTEQHQCQCCKWVSEWVSEWIGFNVPINTLQVISETSLSTQSLALVLTTQKEQPGDRTHKQHKNNTT